MKECIPNASHWEALNSNVVVELTLLREITVANSLYFSLYASYLDRKISLAAECGDLFANDK